MQRSISRLGFCVLFLVAPAGCGQSGANSAPAGSTDQPTSNADPSGGSAGSQTGGSSSSGAAGDGLGGASGNASAAGGTARSDPGTAGEAGGTSVIELPTVTSLVTSPLELTPSFSSSIADYYVRCAAGDNALTVTTTEADEPHVQTLTLSPNQATTIAGQYWIRCLPPDFPGIVMKRPGSPTPGYYLVNSTTYAIVFDTHGVPVWYAHGSAVSNVDSPFPNSVSLMPNYASGAGNDSTSPFEVRSLATNLVTRVASPSGLTDLHELRALANGDYLLYTTPLTAGIDLTGLQAYGANATIADCEIEELDPSGNLVWSWLASAHVEAARESLEQAPEMAGSTPVIDVFHCNSIEPDPGGNLLISMRHTNALYYIDRATGQVLWKLGGTAYNKDGAALIAVQGDSETTFSMQHDARFRPNGNISLFDDHGAAPGVARGMEYAIDHDAGIATPVFQFLGTAASLYEGSFRRYDDGESVVGWGYVPTDARFLTEVDAQGNDVFDLTFSTSEVTYRAVKVPLTQLDIGLLRSTSGE